MHSSTIRNRNEGNRNNTTVVPYSCSINPSITLIVVIITSITIFDCFSVWLHCGTRDRVITTSEMLFLDSTKRWNERFFTLIRTHVTPERSIPCANDNRFRFTSNDTTRHEAQIGLVKQMRTSRRRTRHDGNMEEERWAAVALHHRVFSEELGPIDLDGIRTCNESTIGRNNHIGL